VSSIESEQTKASKGRISVRTDFLHRQGLYLHQEFVFNLKSFPVCFPDEFVRKKVAVSSQRNGAERTISGKQQIQLNQTHLPGVSVTALISPLGTLSSTLWLARTTEEAMLESVGNSESCMSSRNLSIT
jgi:hypothetical protein